MTEKVQNNISTLLSEFKEDLNTFEIETDFRKKGMMIGTLHSHNLNLLSIVSQQTSILSKRKLQSQITPLSEKFQKLENSFLYQTQLQFYEEQISKFMFKVAPCYSSESSEHHLQQCLPLLKKIQTQYDDLQRIKFTGSIDTDVQQKYQQLLDIFRFAIQKFQKTFSKELSNTTTISKRLDAQMIQSSSQIPAQKSKQLHLSDSRSEGDDNEDEFRSSNNHSSGMSQQQLQKQKIEQFLIDEEEIMRERDEQIILLAQDTKQITHAMNQITQMVIEQGQQVEQIEGETDETLKQVRLAEVEINEANAISKKSTSRLMSAKGAILGGGVGFLAGGPIGTFVGSLVGASIGKVVSSIANGFSSNSSSSSQSLPPPPPQ